MAPLTKNLTGAMKSFRAYTVVIGICLLLAMTISLLSLSYRRAREEAFRLGAGVSRSKR